MIMKGYGKPEDFNAEDLQNIGAQFLNPMMVKKIKPEVMKERVADFKDDKVLFYKG